MVLKPSDVDNLRKNIPGIFEVWPEDIETLRADPYALTRIGGSWQEQLNGMVVDIGRLGQELVMLYDAGLECNSVSGSDLLIYDCRRFLKPNLQETAPNTLEG